MIESTTLSLDESETREVIEEASGARDTIIITFIYHKERERIPTDINKFHVPTDAVLDRIANLKPVTHNWCEQVE